MIQSSTPGIQGLESQGCDWIVFTQQLWIPVSASISSPPELAPSQLWVHQTVQTLATARRGNGQLRGRGLDLGGVCMEAGGSGARRGRRRRRRLRWRGAHGEDGEDCRIPGESKEMAALEGLVFTQQAAQSCQVNIEREIETVGRFHTLAGQKWLVTGCSLGSLGHSARRL